MNGTESHAEMGGRSAPIWAAAFSPTLLTSDFEGRRAELTPPLGRHSDEDPPGRGDRTRADEGRGHAADTPSETPAKGWKDILLRIYRGISGDRILFVAAGVTVLHSLGDISRYRGPDFDIRPVRRPSQ